MDALIVQTGGLKDVVDTLAALTDLARARPTCRVDWVVDEPWVPIARAHFFPGRVMGVDLARWRRSPIKAAAEGAWRDLQRQFRQDHYRMVLDLQGTMESSLISRLAKAGSRWGLGGNAARSPLASLLTSQDMYAEKRDITALRRLFAAAFEYPLDTALLQYGISNQLFRGEIKVDEEYVVLLHAASHDGEVWSERQWARLAQRANGDQYRVCLPWETQAERYRAIRIAEAAEDAEVLPRMTSGNMMAVLHGAYGVVGAECGWTALARALDVSVQTIEAAAPEEDGALGVWDKLRERIAEFGYR